MLQADLLRRRNRGKGAYLIDQHVLDLVRADRHIAAAEPDEVGQARMRAHRDASVAGHADGVAHHNGIAGVIAAGDVRGADALHQLGVLAEGPVPEGFAEIGVEVDDHDPQSRDQCYRRCGQSSGERCRRPRQGSDYHGQMIADERRERFPLPVDVGPVAAEPLNAEPPGGFPLPSFGVTADYMRIGHRIARHDRTAERLCGLVSIALHHREILP